MAYTQVDSVVYWWLDGYVGFTQAQAARTRGAIGQWLAWHRRTQLPDYAVLLQRAADEVGRDASGTQVCRWVDEARRRADVTIEEALAPAVALAISLDADQFASIERKQAERMRELRDEYLQPDPKERLEASVERALEQARRLYGDIEPPQRQRIEAIVAGSPFDAQRWLVERERRQRDLIATLKQVQAPSLSPTDRIAALRGYWQRVKHSPDESYARYQQKLESYNCEQSAVFHNLTTPEQRRSAQRTLRGWEGDLRALASPPA